MTFFSVSEKGNKCHFSVCSGFFTGLPVLNTVLGNKLCTIIVNYKVSLWSKLCHKDVAQGRVQG